MEDRHHRINHGKTEYGMKKSMAFWGLIVSVMVLFAPISLFSQQQEQDKSKDAAGEEKEKTVEDIFLQSVELKIIGELAFSSDRDMKVEALDSLEEMINDGRVQEGDEEVHYILDALSLEGTGAQYRENGRMINNFPEIRRRACELLGKMGGIKSKDSLINILLNDEEPMVKAEAAYALGSIGYNENNQVTEALAFSILNDDIMTPDNNFAFASLLAFEKLLDSNDTLNDASVYRALVRISSGNYIRPVKQKAQEVIKKLQQL